MGRMEPRRTDRLLRASSISGAATKLANSPCRARARWSSAWTKRGKSTYGTGRIMPAAAPSVTLRRLRPQLRADFSAEPPEPQMGPPDRDGLERSRPLRRGRRAPFQGSTRESADPLSPPDGTPWLTDDSDAPRRYLAPARQSAPAPQRPLQLRRQPAPE